MLFQIFISRCISYGTFGEDERKMIHRRLEHKMCIIMTLANDRPTLTYKDVYFITIIDQKQTKLSNGQTRSSRFKLKTKLTTANDQVWCLDGAPGLAIVGSRP